MPQSIKDALDQSAYFMPHGHCYLWIPSVLWLHVLSDFLIGAAYVGISLLLVLLVRRIRLPFSPVFIAFGLFIALCGGTHFMEIWTVWHPDYIAAGLLKSATALASVATAVGLVRIRPQVEDVVHAARLSEERRVRLEGTNAELEAMVSRVREADELKSRFLANVSHELRTPLTLMLGPADQLLQADNLTASQRRQIEGLRASGQMLLKQVNDLLDLAKLDFGNMALARTEFDSAAWFRGVSSQFNTAAEQRRITFNIEAPPHLVARVDQDKAERILVNLLSNAFKFTPTGGDVSAVLLARQDGIQLSVSDSGPGVPMQQRELIFERFRQAENGTANSQGGTGLGLSIVREFAALHGGQVSVGEAGLGGARFAVMLPNSPLGDAVANQASHTAQVALEGTLHDLSVKSAVESGEVLRSIAGRPELLLIEDNAQMRTFVADVLSAHFNVATAADGKEGLAKAAAQHPDLIITDLMMPRMSGDQFVHELRSDAHFDSVPILLLTARLDDELRVRLLANGAQDYLTKPFRPQELVARVRNLVETKRAGDVLRSALASLSTDIGDLASQVSAKNRALKLALEAAEVAREQAEQATRARSFFLGMISHELRTPLSVIDMNLQLLAGASGKGEVTAAFTPRIERCLRASGQMVSMVDGLLEFTRAESGQLTVTLEAVDLVQLVGGIIEQLQDTAPTEVALVYEPTGQELAPVEIDPRLLTVVVSNLVANALKFTSEGSVTVRVSGTPSARVIEVQDTGMGISSEDLVRIFRPFEQLEPLRRKSIPGIGLGLALVEQLVHALKGRIDVSSIPATGTTFTVTLPVVTPPGAVP